MDFISPGGCGASQVNIQKRAARFKGEGAYQNDWSGTNQEGTGFTQGLVLPEGIYFYILDHNRNDLPQYVKPQTKGNVYIKP